MDVTMLLCDHAQVAEGKLYVLGGGWNAAESPDTPFPAALAVVIAVPWTATNEKHELVVKLIDDDGTQVTAMDNPVTVAGEFEVGRPPGIKAGSALNQVFVFKFPGLLLAAGGYVFELAINDDVLANAPFRVG
jgi:hypothetical protein